MYVFAFHLRGFLLTFTLKSLLRTKKSGGIQAQHQTELMGIVNTI